MCASHAKILMRWMNSQPRFVHSIQECIYAYGMVVTWRVLEIPSTHGPTQRQAQDSIPIYRMLHSSGLQLNQGLFTYMWRVCHTNKLRKWQRT